ncbi:MAG: COX15/CtaA family protein [Candidatus Neomarinimicrobiota bacterium]|nr:COX15/CtaA family protein [Candidatus Neomarinimicrobiota bacterium]
MSSYHGKYHPYLHYWCFFTTICTFCLIFVGALVKSTESGLSVPDWPTTYGENMFLFPISSMVGGVLYEHGHRLFASFIGFLILVQTTWILSVEKRSWIRKISVITLGTVIFQGTLGGLTVYYLLPIWISASHGTIAQTTLCLTVLLTVSTSKKWIKQSKENISPKLFKISLIVTILIWIQLVLGALMRHSESGLIAFDFPLMNGDLIPTVDKIYDYNQLRNNFIWENIDNSDSTLTHRHLLDEHLEPITPFKMLIHFAHRFWALVVFTGIIYLLFSTYKLNKNKHLMKIPVFILLITAIGQIILGVFSIWSIRDILITTMHVSNGSLVLAVSFYITIWTWRLKLNTYDFNA